jgi:hypothetical protein
LARGAAFDYYEFVSDTRLTDEEWQKMLKDNSQPPQPEWTKSFKSGVKSYRFPRIRTTNIVARAF